MPVLRTDLAPGDRAHLMRAVLATEAALRNLLQSLKMNLASLGNLVPHVRRHVDLHVIPRCAADGDVLQAVRSERQRDAVTKALPEGFDDALAARLAGEPGAPA